MLHLLFCPKTQLFLLTSGHLVRTSYPKIISSTLPSFSMSINLQKYDLPCSHQVEYESTNKMRSLPSGLLFRIVQFVTIQARFVYAIGNPAAKRRRIVILFLISHTASGFALMEMRPSKRLEDTLTKL